MKLKVSSVRTSLYSKLVVTYFVVILVSFVLLAAVLSVWFQNYYYNQKRQSMLSQARIVNGLYEDLKYGNIEPEKFKESLGYIDNLLNTRIWFVDLFSTVQAVSEDADEKMVGKEINTVEVNNVLKKGVEISKEGLFSDKLKTPFYTVMFPLQINNQIAGVTIMNTPVFDIKSALNGIYFFIWLAAIIAIFISTFIIYYFSQRILVKPLFEINKTAREISNGEFEKRVDTTSRDEIGQLGESFNFMADALQNLENLRRDFIANISHELRSPITSIRGFLQGILDGTIPENKYKYYINTALGESKRLTRLISDILDLSRLESGEFSLNTSSFDLNELIRLIILRFENEIESKKLNVDIIFSGDMLYVSADMDRIGQVISNLVDNAIKFTPESGEIGISTMIQGKRVIVSVKDTGMGIPEDQVKLIWDRFHMVDKSRSTKRGTGLGLTIVRQIIKQHGEEIWVESKEGEGSTFSFTLKIDQNI